VDDPAQDAAAESLCTQCGTRADAGLIFCKKCASSLRPPTPLVSSLGRDVNPGQTPRHPGTAILLVFLVCAMFDFALQQMTRPASTKLTPELARELCLRAGSKAYIAGTVGGLGSEYVLGLKAVNCQSGDMLAQEQVTAASKEKVLDALGEAASKLRTELGESLATVKKFDVPLEQATTSSLDALRAYSLGRKAKNEKGFRRSPGLRSSCHRA
jgi:hypothetical protein